MVKQLKSKLKRAALKKTKPKSSPKPGSKPVYKKAKNGRYYKLVGGRPRFVSNAEAKQSGLGSRTDTTKAK